MKTVITEMFKEVGILIIAMLCIAFTVLTSSVGCSKPPVVGHVVKDADGNVQVDFGGGTTGGCYFNNDPHEGDDVVISDQKSGTCHALPHKVQ